MKVSPSSMVDNPWSSPEAASRWMRVRDEEYRKGRSLSTCETVMTFFFTAITVATVSSVRSNFFMLVKALQEERYWEWYHVGSLSLALFLGYCLATIPIGYGSDTRYSVLASRVPRDTVTGEMIPRNPVDEYLFGADDLIELETLQNDQPIYGQNFGDDASCISPNKVKDPKQNREKRVRHKKLKKIREKMSNNFNRYGPRWILTLSFFLYSFVQLVIGVCLTSIRHTALFWTLLPFLFLSGVLEACVAVTAMNIVTKEVPSRLKSIMAALIGCISYLGLGFGSLLPVEANMSKSGMRVFIVYGVAGLIFSVIMFIWMIAAVDEKAERDELENHRLDDMEYKKGGEELEVRQDGACKRIGRSWVRLVFMSVVDGMWVQKHGAIRAAGGMNFALSAAIHLLMTENQLPNQVTSHMQFIGSWLLPTMDKYSEYFSTEEKVNILNNNFANLVDEFSRGDDVDASLMEVHKDTIQNVIDEITGDDETGELEQLEDDLNEKAEETLKETDTYEEDPVAALQQEMQIMLEKMNALMTAKTKLDGRRLEGQRRYLRGRYKRKRHKKHKQNRGVVDFFSQVPKLPNSDKELADLAPPQRDENNNIVLEEDDSFSESTDLAVMDDEEARIAAIKERMARRAERRKRRKERIYSQMNLKASQGFETPDQLAEHIRQFQTPKEFQPTSVIRTRLYFAIACVGVLGTLIFPIINNCRNSEGSYRLKSIVSTLVGFGTAGCLIASSIIFFRLGGTTILEMDDSFNRAIILTKTGLILFGFHISSIYAAHVFIAPMKPGIVYATILMYGKAGECFAALFQICSKIVADKLNIMHITIDVAALSAIMLWSIIVWAMKASFNPLEELVPKAPDGSPSKRLELAKAIE